MNVIEFEGRFLIVLHFLNLYAGAIAQGKQSLHPFKFLASCSNSLKRKKLSNQILTWV